MRVKEFIIESPVGDLQKDLKNPKSYDAIDHMMQTIARKHGIDGKKLHDLFVAKFKMTPDEYAKKMTEDNQDYQEPQQQQPQPSAQGPSGRDVLNTVRQIGQAVNTWKDKDIGAIAKDELLQMLKKKARGEPNQ